LIKNIYIPIAVLILVVSMLPSRAESTKNSDDDINIGIPGVVQPAPGKVPPKKPVPPCPV